MKTLFTILLFWNLSGFGLAQEKIQKDSFLLSEVTNQFVGHFPLFIMLQPDSQVLRDGKKRSVFNKVFVAKELKATYVEEQIRTEHAYTHVEWRDDIVIVPRFKGEKVQCFPAQYDTLVEKVEIQPAHFKFVKRNLRRSTLSADVDSRAFQCFKRVPRASDSIIVRRYVLKEPPKIIRRSRNQREVEILSLASDSLFRREIPAKYQLIHRLVTPNDFWILGRDTASYFGSSWLPKQGTFYLRAVVHSSPLRTPRMDLIQVALKKKGYYQGRIEDVFNPECKKALIQFQKDHRLKIGNLDLETCKRLNVNPFERIISDLNDEYDTGFSTED